LPFQIDASFIDKSLPVPVGRQLYGLLSYLLSHGDFERGTRLPSVRRMSAQLAIAQATVAQVYQDLRDAGLIEMRQGSGAYTRLALPKAPEHNDNALRTDIEVLLGKAERLGLSTMALISMVSAQARLRQGRAGLDILFVGVFERPAADYVDSIRPLLSPRDNISLVTIEQVQTDAEARAACAAADLVLTFVHRETELRRLLPDANVRGLRFIPSEQTRQALALLDPRARIAAITQLKDYIAIMRPSVQRYAPHVSDIRVTWSYAPDLVRIIAEADVVIFASGADHVAAKVRPGVPCFEYRHMPDPAALETELAPYLAELREAAASGAQRSLGAGPRLMSGAR
jgi:DNA-binding transcriptional regulator YhcF (GntR family)